MTSNAPPPPGPPDEPPADPPPPPPPSLAVRSPETTAQPPPPGPLRQPGTPAPPAKPPIPPVPAPAKPAETQAPDASRTACPSCSAMNPVTAEFCWQCHNRMRGPALGAPAGVTGPALAAQQHTGPGAPTRSVGQYEDRQARVTATDYTVPLPSSKAKRNPFASALRVILPLAAAIGGLYLGFQLFSGGVKIPDEIGGLQKIENPLANDFLDAIRSAYERQGLDADLAYFGQGAQPSMYVVVLQGEQLPTPELLLAELSSVQGEAGLGDVAQREWQGATYQCASAGGAFQGACLWRQDDVLGAVVSYDRDVQATFEFAIEAHDAIHGD